MITNLTEAAIFIAGLMAGLFIYRAIRYAKNRWNVPTFDGWREIWKRSIK